MWTDTPRARDLTDAFASAFGHEPAGEWAAPGRINLIGEHTDYNDGYALPLALPLRVVVAAGRRDDGVLSLRSRARPNEPARVRIADLAPEAPGSPRGWAAYVAGVGWTLREAGYGVGGADILVDSDLPSGSGLSSSAALECAALLALRDLYELPVPGNALARLAQRAENDFVGMPCGVMDQMAVLSCEAGNGLFLDCRDLSTSLVPLDLDRTGLRLAVIDTRAPHRHVDGEYAARRRSCEQAAAALGVVSLREIDPEGLPSALARLGPESVRRVRHVVGENARVLDTVRHLRSGDTETWEPVGALLTASHVSLRDDYEVSSPELDVAVDAALEAGALGARMTGGGFGGCAIALIDAESVPSLTASVEAAYRSRDFTPPRVFMAAAAAGARRVH